MLSISRFPWQQVIGNPHSDLTLLLDHRKELQLGMRIGKSSSRRNIETPTVPTAGEHAFVKLSRCQFRFAMWASTQESPQLPFVPGEHNAMLPHPPTA